MLVADALGGRLSKNPIEDITHRTGDWTLYLLLTTLAVTPLRRLTGWNVLIRFRRTIGLLAFSYACMHLLTYAVLDQGLFLQGHVLKYLADDITKRPFITVGFSAFCMLLPLALTSTKRSIRRLGGTRWNALHRLIYVAGALAVLHYLWLVKGKQWRPVYFALVLVGLLVTRLIHARKVTPSTDARLRGDRPEAGPRLSPPAAPDPDPL